MRGRGRSRGGLVLTTGASRAHGDAAYSAVSQVSDLRMLGRGDVVQKRVHLPLHMKEGDAPVRVGQQLHNCVIDLPLAKQMRRSQEYTHREVRPKTICASVDAYRLAVQLVAR